MPYGNYSTPKTAYTLTIHSSSRATGELVIIPSGYRNFVNYTSPFIIRTGENTPNWFSPSTIYDIPYYELQTYKKVIKVLTGLRKERYWVKDKNDPRFSVRHTRKVEYKKKIYGYGIRYTRKKLSGSQPTDQLFKPNALTFIKQETFCDLSVINIRQQRTDGFGDVYNDNAISWNGYPGEPVARNSDGVAVYQLYGMTSDPIWLPFPSATSFPPGLSDEVISKLYNKVAEEFPDYVTDALQIGSTWKTITKIALSAIEVVYAMVKLDLKRLRGSLPGITAKDISSMWLEFIYGVVPVLDDIDKSIDLYMRHSRRWRTYSCSKKEILVEQNSGVFGFEPYGEYNYTETLTTTYTIRYGCIMAGDESFKRKVRKDNTVISAFATVWEVIPYSFCIDWIYNLGNYLQSSQSMNDSLLYQWRTTIVKQEMVRHYTVFSHPEIGIINEGDPFTLTGTRISVIRDPSISLPGMPAPKVKRLSQVFSFKRSLNALALFTQLVTRK